MLRMKFWTSQNLVEKWPKRPRDHHDRIRLEKLCPNVVSDCQNAGRMTSKHRFWHFRPTIENPGQNVNFLARLLCCVLALDKKQGQHTFPPILWGLGLLDRLYASYRRNTLETTISRSIWIDSGGTVESTLRFRSKIQVSW